MKKITKKELEKILEKHQLWLNDDPEGERADLRDTYLHGKDLSWCDLRGANLSGANLHRVKLMYSQLDSADLTNANLSEAILYCSNLTRADLTNANLNFADLRMTNLKNANLTNSACKGALVNGANLVYADLSESLLSRVPMVCPEVGAFTAFKKARGYIVKLLIPKDARRSSSTSRKCRCSKAKVLSIENIDGTKSRLKSIESDYDPKFIYRVGKTVSVKYFEKDRWDECAPGIHFFITRQEAVDYIY